MTENPFATCRARSPSFGTANHDVPRILRPSPCLKDGVTTLTRPSLADPRKYVRLLSFFFFPETERRAQTHEARPPCGIELCGSPMRSSRGSSWSRKWLGGHTPGGVQRHSATTVVRPSFILFGVSFVGGKACRGAITDWVTPPVPLVLFSSFWRGFASIGGCRLPDTCARIFCEEWRIPCFSRVVEFKSEMLVTCANGGPLYSSAFRGQCRFRHRTRKLSLCA